MTNSAPPDEWLEAANLQATIAQLLSAVIHQVNNALQTIGGHAELLKSDPGVTDTTKRRAATISDVTGRTAEMLAGFQVITRPAPEPIVLDLREVTTRALAFRQYGLGRARIRASIAGADAAPVRATIRPLVQAVLNVILNAEQALGGGAGGRIDLTVSVADGWAFLTVDDDGPGAAAAHVSQADDREPLTLGANNRLGVGLPVARAILERLGGRLTVSASPLGGTRVVIALPTAEEGRSSAER